MTLEGFLLARIAEDEDVARGSWLESDVERTSFGLRYDPKFEAQVQAKGTDEVIAHLASIEDGLHVVRWSPSRVLAECEAKRSVVVRCSANFGCPLHASTLEPSECRDCEHAEGARAFGRQIIRDMARPHRDHPDYDERWAS